MTLTGSQKSQVLVIEITHSKICLKTYLLNKFVTNEGGNLFHQFANNRFTLENQLS